MDSPSSTSKNTDAQAPSTNLAAKAPPFAPLEPTPALLAELAEQSNRLETATPQEILHWASERFAPYFSMATAFGPEGMSIIHMLAEIAPKLRSSTWKRVTSFQKPWNCESE